MYNVYGNQKKINMVTKPEYFLNIILHLEYANISIRRKFRVSTIIFKRMQNVKKKNKKTKSEFRHNPNLESFKTQIPTTYF